MDITLTMTINLITLEPKIGFNITKLLTHSVLNAVFLIANNVLQRNPILKLSFL